MSTPETQPRRTTTAAAYGLLVALSVLAGWALFELHGSLLYVSLALQLNRWVAGAVRQLAFPIIGLVWLIFIFWLEHYLRTGAARGLLLRRAGRALAGIAVLAALAYAARLL